MHMAQQEYFKYQSHNKIFIYHFIWPPSGKLSRQCVYLYRVFSFVHTQTHTDTLGDA